jgi:hypothetical protein
MKIDFSFDTQYGIFSDAIVLQPNDKTLTNDEIEAMKQQRLNDWIISVTPVEE